MNFIQLTDRDGKRIVINAATICQFFEFEPGYTRIIFYLEVGGDHAYEDVQESINEILTRLQEKGGT